MLARNAPWLPLLLVLCQVQDVPFFPSMGRHPCCLARGRQGASLHKPRVSVKLPQYLLSEGTGCVQRWFY